MEIEDIKKNLRNGDYREIAELANCSKELVEAIFNNRRNHDTKKGRKVVEVAQALAEDRINRIENFQVVNEA